MDKIKVKSMVIQNLETAKCDSDNNPFDRALIEYEKNEMRKEQDRMKLIEFRRRVNDRLRAYKLSNEVSDKLKLENKHTQAKSQPKNSWLLKNDNEQMKSRILTTRRVYSSVERNNLKANARKSKNDDKDDYDDDDDDELKVEINLCKNRPSSKQSSNYSQPQPRSLAIHLSGSESDLTKFRDKPNSIKYLSALTTRGKGGTTKALEKTSIDTEYFKKFLKQYSNKLESIPPICQCERLSKEKSQCGKSKTIVLNKCANNCIFYNNPKEYVTILKGLLES